MHPPEQPLRLTQLAAALRQARTVVQSRRTPPAAKAELAVARAALLDAAEAYVAELHLLRMPVPPRLRDELRLLRSCRND
ncbi:hypothetical protein [Ornithinimicrobium humiphilum]|nr:hypothetical protein [Ornithinimicrobium humiphilum]